MTSRLNAPPSNEEPPEETAERQGQTALVRGWALELLSRFFLIAAGAVVLLLLCSAVLIVRRPPEILAVVPIFPTFPPAPTKTPLPSPTPMPPPVALLAGHSGGSDPGAICPDGLREVDVTVDVAKRARAILEARRYRVDILAEFDPRIVNTNREYAPRAFLAIHADSCVYYASGYKVARAENSATPEEDDRLVRCVSAAYAAYTHLPFHAGSITKDMTRYHGLNRISPQAPGAIIEVGFLGSEHDLLKNRRGQVAEGIANGVDDFLRGGQCKEAETKTP